jgi:hypothetical protein
MAVLATALFAVVTACSTPTEPAQRVDIATSNRQILVTNHTGSPIFTAVFGRIVLTVVDWAPCVDPSRCELLDAGGTRAFPYPDAFHGVPETDAVVFWWHATRDIDGTLRPDSIRAVVVHL